MVPRTFAEQQWAFKLLDATIAACEWDDKLSQSKAKTASLRAAMLRDRRDEVSKRAWAKSLEPLAIAEEESALADEELERVVEVIRLSTLEKKELAS